MEKYRESVTSVEKHDHENYIKDISGIREKAAVQSKRKSDLEAALSYNQTDANTSNQTQQELDACTSDLEMLKLNIELFELVERLRDTLIKKMDADMARLDHLKEQDQ